jgi:pilus assembly protein Flp/PilA
MVGRLDPRRRGRSPGVLGGRKMNAILRRLHAFLVSEDGPTATEYGVMLALIIIVALGAITALGGKVSTTYSNINTALPNG